jgi:hypothetical protein
MYMGQRQSGKREARDPVPNRASMNPGLTAATLIACIATIPSAVCTRAIPFITKLENANTTPAIRPQPGAVPSVNA